MPRLRKMGNCRSKTEESTENIEPASDDHINKKPTLDKDYIKAKFTNHRVGNPDPNGNRKLPQSSLGTNDNVINATKAEVSSLLEGIQEFQGTTDKDKNYMYLDEMLTRCILRLDNIECNSTQDRGNRKEAIRGVNQAISILERKLEFNFDMKKLESDLGENS